jgi:AraC-like DNA-binding protein
MEIPPGPALAPFVRCLWSLRAPAGAAPIQSVLPDGHMELVLHLGDRFDRHAEDGSIETQARALLAGQIRQRLLLQPRGRIDVVGVRFRPGGVSGLFGVPAHLLTDHIPPAGDVDAALAAGPDIAADASNPHERLVRVEEWLLDGFRNRIAPDARVAHAARLLSTRGRVSDAARAVGWTARHLERRFSAEVGLGPVTFARIARIQAVVRAATVPVPPSWSRIAHACGFADQSHLIREFRSFALETPGEFFSRTNPMTESFAADPA